MSYTEDSGSPACTCPATGNGRILLGVSDGFAVRPQLILAQFDVVIPGDAIPPASTCTARKKAFAVALPGSHANTTPPVYPLAGADWAEHDGDGGVHLVQPAATARGESGLASCAAGESSSGDKRVTISSGSQRTLADASPRIIRKTWGQRSPATPSGLVKAHS